MILRFCLLISFGLALPLAFGQADKVDPPAPARGDVAGEVTWKGALFPPRPVIWPAGEGLPKALMKLRDAGLPRDERLRIDAKTRGIADVLLRIPSLTMPTRPAKRLRLEIRNLAFSTRIAVLPPGWSLVIRNDDVVSHEIVVTKNGKGAGITKLAIGAEADLGRIQQGDFRLHSKVFPFLVARVVMPQSAPALVTQADGAFRIRSLPVGKHRFLFEHETLGRVEREVEVLAGKTAQLKISSRDFVDSKRPQVSWPFGKVKKSALSVDGLAVPRSAIDKATRSLAERHSEFAPPRLWLEQKALERVILPVAASWAALTTEELARLVNKSKEVDTLFASGQKFDEIAAALSEEPMLRRGRPTPALLRHEFDPLLSSLVFSAPLREVQGPIASARGLHFIEVVTEKGRGTTARRSVRQILIKLDSRSEIGELDERARKRGEEAQVQVYDRALASAVPLRNRR